MKSIRFHTKFHQQQQGIALYVALIMLLILTLLGVAASQVSTMQERMAGNFDTVNLSFQNVEEKIRFKEFELKQVMDRTGAYVPDVFAGCSKNIDAWAKQQTASDDSQACTTEVPELASSSLLEGQNPLNEEFPSFQLYASAVDRYADENKIKPGTASTVSVLETVFIP